MPVEAIPSLSRGPVSIARQSKSSLLIHGMDVPIIKGLLFFENDFSSLLTNILIPLWVLQSSFWNKYFEKSAISKTLPSIHYYLETIALFKHPRRGSSIKIWLHRF